MSIPEYILLRARHLPEYRAAHTHSPDWHFAYAEPWNACTLLRRHMAEDLRELAEEHGPEALAYAEAAIAYADEEEERYLLLGYPVDGTEGARLLRQWLAARVQLADLLAVLVGVEL